MAESELVCHVCVVRVAVLDDHSCSVTLVGSAHLVSGVISALQCFAEYVDCVVMFVGPVGDVRQLVDSITDRTLSNVAVVM